MNTIPDEELAKICYEPDAIINTELQKLTEDYNNVKKEYEDIASKHIKEVGRNENLSSELEKIKIENKTLKELIICFSKLL